MMTEDEVKALGFVQQNPPDLWDLDLGNDLGVLRMQKHEPYVAGQDGYWTIRSLKTDHWNSGSVMNDQRAIVLFLAYSFHHRGMQETQKKVSDALGLDTLVEKVADRVYDLIKD